MRSSPFLLVILLFFGCKQATTKVVERYTRGQVKTEYFYPNKNDTSTYTCQVYYENGKLKFKAQVVSNKFIGEKETFYQNGMLQRIEKLNQPTQLNDAKYDCYIINFRPNGAKESEYQYLKNKISGLVIDYDSMGNKSRTAEYVDGRTNGKETLYYSNGKIKSIVFLKNDTLRGLDIDFKENGDTLKWFHNGEYGLHGVFYKKWLDNGLILTGNYGDTLESYVVWKWLDKTNNVIKSKVVKSKNGEYIAPE